VAIAVLVLSSFRFYIHFYPNELFNHFQFQYFIASVASLVILTSLRRWRMLVVACVALVVSGSAVAPMWFSPQTIKAVNSTTTPTTSIRILHANVLSSNNQHSLLLDLIAKEQPDLVMLQEINSDWLEALDSLASDYPFSCISSREDNFGMAVYSRLPLLDAAVRQFGSAPVPSMFFQIEFDNTLIDVIASHPMPPSSAAAQSSRDEQITEIAAFAEGRANPLIFVGDLNTTMWTASYRSLCQKLGLTNARNGFGVMPSWPANLPGFMRIPIDHILISDEFLAVDCRLGPKIGSDHLPLIVELQLAR